MTPSDQTPTPPSTSPATVELPKLRDALGLSGNLPASTLLGVVARLRTDANLETARNRTPNAVVADLAKELDDARRVIAELERQRAELREAARAQRALNWLAKQNGTNVSDNGAGQWSMYFGGYAEEKLATAGSPLEMLEAAMWAAGDLEPPSDNGRYVKQEETVIPPPSVTLDGVTYAAVQLADPLPDSTWLDEIDAAVKKRGAGCVIMHDATAAALLLDIEHLTARANEASRYKDALEWLDDRKGGTRNVSVNVHAGEDGLFLNVWRKGHDYAEYGPGSLLECVDEARQAETADLTLHIQNVDASADPVEVQFGVAAPRGEEPLGGVDLSRYTTCSRPGCNTFLPWGATCACGRKAPEKPSGDGEDERADPAGALGLAERLQESFRQGFHAGQQDADHRPIREAPAHPTSARHRILCQIECEHPAPTERASGSDPRSAFAAGIDRWCPVCGAVLADGEWLAASRSYVAGGAS